MLGQNEPKKQLAVVFAFMGGEMDGQEIRSDRPHVGTIEAQTLWALTRKGQSRRSFYVPIPNRAIARQRYRVSTMSEAESEIRVVCRFVAE